MHPRVASPGATIALVTPIIHRLGLTPPSMVLSTFVRRLVTGMSLPLAAFSQPSVSASLGGSTDAFRPAAGSLESRRAFSGALDITNGFAAGHGQLSYTLDFGSFDSPGDWSYQRHDAAGSYRVVGDDSTSRRLYLTGSASLRRNGDAWSSASYAAAAAGLNLELARPGVTTRLGYRIDARRFSDLSALSQLEQRAFASTIANLPATRTTLIVEGALGAKSYTGVVADGGLDTVAVSPRGRGYGAGLSAAGTSYTTLITPSTSTQRGTAHLGTLMARVARGFTDRTGAYAEFSARRTFGDLPPLLIVTPAGFVEDGIYDDPFASDGEFVESGLKHVFANAAVLTMSGWWAAKRFTSSVALDTSGAPLAGDPLRRDQLALGRVAWSQPLFPSHTGAVALTAEAAYRFLRHTSNDALYDYRAHIVSVGFSLRY